MMHSGKLIQLLVRRLGEVYEQSLLTFKVTFINNHFVTSRSFEEKPHHFRARQMKTQISRNISMTLHNLEYLTYMVYYAF